MNCDVVAPKILQFGDFFCYLIVSILDTFGHNKVNSQCELDLESGNIFPSSSNLKTAPCSEQTGFALLPHDNPVLLTAGS